MNVIQLAIEPLRQISIEVAEVGAIRAIADMHERFSKYNYDMWDACSFQDIDGKVYYSANLLFLNLTAPLVPSVNGIVNKENRYKRKPCALAEAKFIKDAKDDASVAFDKYVAKMIKKIGDVKSAEMTSVYNRNVWGFSVLSVINQDDEVSSWKTQQIVNVSKLGKLFNQWPTRKMK